eukprot:14845623-Alexandrium_andersonii.AAC.1
MAPLWDHAAARDRRAEPQVPELRHAMHHSDGTCDTLSKVPASEGPASISEGVHERLNGGRSNPINSDGVEELAGKRGRHEVSKKLNPGNASDALANTPPRAHEEPLDGFLAVTAHAPTRKVNLATSQFAELQHRAGSGSKGHELRAQDTSTRKG